MPATPLFWWSVKPACFFVCLFFSYGKYIVGSSLAIFSIFLLLKLHHFLPSLHASIHTRAALLNHGFPKGAGGFPLPTHECGSHMLSWEEQGLWVCWARIQTPAPKHTNTVTLGRWLSEPALSFLTYKKRGRNGTYLIGLGGKTVWRRIVCKVLGKL